MFCKYVLQRRHGHDSGFHLLITVLKLSTNSLFFKSFGRLSLKTVRFLSHDLRFKPEELQNLFDFASYNFLVPKPEKLLALSLEKIWCVL